MRGGAKTSTSRIPSPRNALRGVDDACRNYRSGRTANFQVHVRPPVSTVCGPGHAQVVQPATLERYRSLLEIGMRMRRQLRLVARFKEARVRHHHELAGAKGMDHPAARIGVERGVAAQSIAPDRFRPRHHGRDFRRTVGIERGIGRKPGQRLVRGDLLHHQAWPFEPDSPFARRQDGQVFNIQHFVAIARRDHDAPIECIDELLVLAPCRSR